MIDYEIKYNYIIRLIKSGIKVKYKTLIDEVEIIDGILYGNYADKKVKIDCHNIKHISIGNGFNPHLHIYNKETKKLILCRKCLTDAQKYRLLNKYDFNYDNLDYHILQHGKEVLLYDV